MPVIQPETALDGAIQAALHLVQPDSPDFKKIRQPVSQSFGQIGHLLKRSGSFLPDPFPDLPGPESWFAQLTGQLTGQGLFVHQADIHFGGHYIHYVKIVSRLIFKLPAV